MHVIIMLPMISSDVHIVLCRLVVAIVYYVAQHAVTSSLQNVVLVPQAELGHCFTNP